MRNATPRHRYCTHLVDDLIPTVVTLPGQTLRVFVGESAAEAIHDRAGREVLGGDELQSLPLSVLLLLQQLEHLRVVLLQALIARQCLGDH